MSLHPALAAGALLCAALLYYLGLAYAFSLSVRWEPSAAASFTVTLVIPAVVVAIGGHFLGIGTRLPRSLRYVVLLALGFGVAFVASGSLFVFACLFFHMCI